MAKEKFLEDDASLDYKKRLKEFMAQINPKPTEETIQKLKEQYIAQRRAL
jgi:hypothetical protein